MHKKFYLCRMSFLRYDSEHFLLFLSEQRVENYHPDSNMSESDGDSQAVTAYSYEGSEIDGSTKIEAKSASYREFVNGLVRTRYSQGDVEAILCNHGDGNKEHDEGYKIGKRDPSQQLLSVCLSVKSSIAQVLASWFQKDARRGICDCPSCSDLDVKRNGQPSSRSSFLEVLACPYSLL